MKKLKTSILFAAILLVVSCILSTELLAQGPGFDEGVEDTPIDGGVTLIAATAVGYGIKKLRDKKRKFDDNNDIT